MSTQAEFASEFAVDVRNVTKTYGTGQVAYQALRGVDFRVKQGEFVMLSGPSGSGKTTLLSILGCVLSASSGSVELFGHDITNATERTLPKLRRAMVGFIFQGHNLLASHSALENVALVLEMRGAKRKDALEESAALLMKVGLGSKLKNKPGDLSGGQRQRVSIARALVGSPPLILADEPTASLDAASGAQATDLLKSLAKEHNRTVVVVTHDNRIFHYADRIVEIEDGLISSNEANHS